LAAKTLLECSFYIPTRRDKNLSDGKPHKRRAWKWLDNSLEVFGGVTEPTAPYRGWYLDRETGERVPDVSRKYIVAVPRWQVNDLRAVLRDACSVFQQKCIYLSIAGHVEFVEGRAHESE
jgi:hypothetical protein